MNKGVKAFLGIVSVSPILFLIGLALSFVAYAYFPIRLIPVEKLGADIVIAIGALLILGGTALAFAAQRISRIVARPSHTATCQSLMQGPYAYSRHPGTLSLIIMYVGFALIANSLVMSLIAVVITLILTFIFVPMQERVIMSLCPEAYTEYKTKVRMWL